VSANAHESRARRINKRLREAAEGLTPDFTGDVEGFGRALRTFGEAAADAGRHQVTYACGCLFEFVNKPFVHEGGCGKVLGLLLLIVPSALLAVLP